MSNRRKFIKQIGSIGALGIISPIDLVKKPKLDHLCIMHTNDVHSHIDAFPENHKKYPGMGGVINRAKLIQKIRSSSQHTLLLDAGDMFQGTPYFNYFGGEVEFKLMNALKYDAATIGNHDFDNGIDGLAKNAINAKFKLLSSNYNFNNTPMDGLTKKHHVFYRGSFKVGVFGIGIKLKGLVDSKMYGNTIYNNPITESKIQTKLLKNQGCNLIICLSHLGLFYGSYESKRKRIKFKHEQDRISDIILAKNCPDIDIIIGGHTHTFLKEPIKINSTLTRKTIINQVGWAGIQLGKIDVYKDFNKKKIMINRTLNNLKIYKT